jgi:hypothetical protein
LATGRKKNDRIKQALTMIEEVKTKYSLSYVSLAHQLGLSCRTLMRWKRRHADGRVAVGKRGPKKVQPLNFTELKEKIQGLDHGRKRSRGTGRLHGAYTGRISRRDLNEMVRQVRIENNRRRIAESCRVSWLRPNLAWAMDDSRKSDTAVLHLHNLTDLCSRYKLPPIASGSPPCGEEVAGHLERLFERFGAPLFCKRDNGGNLNHTAVNQVLEDSLVIPINSPPATASYNGAIERTQREFKDYLNRWQWKADTVEKSILLAETAAHDLNHKSRRCLKGRTSCRAYFGGRRLRYSKRRRESVYRWIRDLASEISIRAGKSIISSAAWRIAAKQWMLKKGLIKIVKAGKVSPHFHRKLCHN